ncbi:hypothetical protein DM02DRAFT_616698 [Periconia macrospinosa]|uniref:Uncharacterized protein n=1 Tax=Periconia macrospinosa TaxID=97972 RepID=A0A2V1DGA1_9PLEO|nr:hypothetical protein DM02DRAFT_616698 [Periconia macrospinosa]
MMDVGYYTPLTDLSAHDTTMGCDDRTSDVALRAPIYHHNTARVKNPLTFPPGRGGGGS